MAAEVAALDPLGELDLVRGGQQLVAAGLVQEQLERVGRDRVRDRSGRLDGVLRVGPQLDVALFEGALELVQVVGREVVLERERLELALLHEAALGGLVEKGLDMSKLKQVVQMILSCRGAWPRTGMSIHAFTATQKVKRYNSREIPLPLPVFLHGHPPNEAAR